MTNRIGHFYELNQATGAAGIATTTVVGVDEIAMSAQALISTPGWDRVNDSVNPMGGDYSEYMLNPIVFWEHGLPEGFSTPIAKSVDSNGKLMMFPSDDGIRAVSFFSNRNKQSEQIFALLADDIVRAASVRVRPKTQPIRKSRGRRIETWLLEEWSWCGLAINPEAVREVVAKGRLAGSPIDTSLLKSLRANMPKSTTTRVSMSGYQPAKRSQATSELLADFGAEPLGSLLIKATHSHLKSLDANINSGMGTLEHSGVRKLLTTVRDTLADVTTALEGGHAENYPDAEMKGCECHTESKSDNAEAPEDMEGDEEGGDKKPAGSFGDKKMPPARDKDKPASGSKKPAFAQDDEEEKEKEENLKSFLASAVIGRFQFVGLNNQLLSMSEAPNLTSVQKSTLRQINRQLGGIVKQATEAAAENDGDEAAPSEREVYLESQVKSLAARLNEMTDALEKAVPHPRRFRR